MRARSSTKVLGALVLAGLGVTAGLVVRGAKADPSRTLETDASHSGSPSGPVIVELFSSEGCSSCPPADEYLAKLDARQAGQTAQPAEPVVIALEEHVDYWDDLGWRDPFAQPYFGARQRQYAGALGDHRVYTPEIILDGHAVMDGGDGEQARRLMRESSREPKARIIAARSGSMLTIDVTDVPRATPDDPAEVWLAITESGLSTEVPRGENAGRHLAHAPVVRQLRSLGRVTAPAFHAQTALELDAAWKPRATRVVVFVQLEKSRRIVGATAL